MTGKRCYLTSLDAWRRHVPRYAESHYVVVSRSDEDAVRDASGGESQHEAQQAAILVLMSGDEAAHIALEGDPEFEALPHPLSRQPISERAAAALAHFGIEQGDDAFTVAEKVARVHPLLRHRVF